MLHKRLKDHEHLLPWYLAILKWWFPQTGKPRSSQRDPSMFNRTTIMLKNIIEMPAKSWCSTLPFFSGGDSCGCIFETKNRHYAGLYGHVHQGIVQGVWCHMLGSLIFLKPKNIGQLTMFQGRSVFTSCCRSGLALLGCGFHLLWLERQYSCWTRKCFTTLGSNRSLGLKNSVMLVYNPH